MAMTMLFDKCDYFSLKELRATQQRITCTVTQTVAKMGHLNPTNSGGSSDLLKGTQLELPLWLVESLLIDGAGGGRKSSSSSMMIVAQLPKIYTENYREIVRVDAYALDLGKLALEYFRVGNHVKAFDVRETRDIVDSLRHTLKHRFRDLMDLAQNTDSALSVLTKLDRLERDLFVVAHAARNEMRKWLVDGALRLEAAPIVANHKKRKRDVDDNH